MKDLSALQRDIARARQDMAKLADNLPRIIGTESVRIVKLNFQLQAYDSGNGITAWPKRKPATNAAYDRGHTYSKSGKRSKYRTGKNGTYKGSVYSSSNPLLRQTLALYNSIHYVASKRTVFVGTSLTLVPYAKAHNESLNHQPLRKYMPTRSEGANPKIISTVKKRIDYETSKAMHLFKK